MKILVDWVDHVQFREAAKENGDAALLKIMSNYGKRCPEQYAFQLSCIYNISDNFLISGEEVVTALGSEVDRLEKEIQYLVPGIRHVDIEAHNPTDLFPWLTLLLGMRNFFFFFFMGWTGYCQSSER